MYIYEYAPQLYYSLYRSNALQNSIYVLSMGNFKNGALDVLDRLICSMQQTVTKLVSISSLQIAGADRDYVFYFQNLILIEATWIEDWIIRNERIPNSSNHTESKAAGKSNQVRFNEVNKMNADISCELSGAENPEY